MGDKKGVDLMREDADVLCGIAVMATLSGDDQVASIVRHIAERLHASATESVALFAALRRSHAHNDELRGLLQRIFDGDACAEHGRFCAPNDEIGALLDRQTPPEAKDAENARLTRAIEAKDAKLEDASDAYSAQKDTIAQMTAELEDHKRRLAENGERTAELLTDHALKDAEIAGLKAELAKHIGSNATEGPSRFWLEGQLEKAEARVATLRVCIKSLDGTYMRAAREREAAEARVAKLEEEQERRFDISKKIVEERETLKQRIAKIAPVVKAAKAWWWNGLARDKWATPDALRPINTDLAKLAEAVIAMKTKEAPDE